MIIREASPADSHQLAKINIESWQEAFIGLFDEHVLTNLSLKKKEARLATALKSETSTFFVIEENYQVVGYSRVGATLSFDLDRSIIGEIGAIYLVPSFWSQGFGRKLFTFSVDYLKASSFNAVMLWVLAGNQRARRFYERMGMHFDGTCKTKEIENVLLPEVRYWLNF